jgi:hypothetical protein
VSIPSLFDVFVAFLRKASFKKLVLNCLKINQSLSSLSHWGRTAGRIASLCAIQFEIIKDFEINWKQVDAGAGVLKKQSHRVFLLKKSPGSRVNAFCVQRCKCRPSVTSEVHFFFRRISSLLLSAKAKNRERARRLCTRSASRVAEPRLANNNAAERCLSIASVNVLSH